MVKQFGYVECLHQFNRNILRSSRGTSFDGPKMSVVLVGLELLNALLEHNDWTLEFVLAASQEDEREAWDRVIDASIHILDGGLEPLTQRYINLFSIIPAHRLQPEVYLADKKQLASLADAQSVVSCLKATFKSGPCEICQRTAGTRCSRCRQVFFCGKPHQRQAWRDHKLVCQESAASRPPGGEETASLVALGYKKIPEDITEAKACALDLLNQQRKAIQLLIAHTRHGSVVMYLHQLHLGTITHPESMVA